MAQGVMTSISAGGMTPTTFAYDKRRLDRLVNSFYFMGYGEEKTLPGNMGVSTSFRRYGNVAAVPTPINEGVTPAGSTLTKVDLTASVAQFGDYITYSDWVDLVGVDGKVIKIIDEVQVDQIADTFDQLVRDMLLAGGTIRYTETSVGDAATAPIVDDLEYIQNYMERRNVKYLKEKTLPGVQISTLGLDPAYVGFFHPDLRTGLEGLTGFVKVSQYPANAKILQGEFGQFKRIKCIATTNAYINAGAGADVTAAIRNNNDDGDGTGHADVYYSIIIGAKAYGNVRLQGGSVKTILKPLGYKDELDQQGSVGWKMAWGGLVLDAQRVHVLVSACGAL